ncbi:hypothetical protein DFJ73DRAFT_893529 [Zopfochytrium polystomum]|nr:hypothetical protein DFJ73DRAFT_893529 [Zopfochytrium polystomum]
MPSSSVPEAAPLLARDADDNDDDEIDAHAAAPPPTPRSCARDHPFAAVAAVAAVLVGASVLLFRHALAPLPAPDGPSAITPHAFAQGLAACRRNARAVAENPVAYLTGGPPPASAKGRRNPRFARLAGAPVAKAGANARPVHIRNATVWDGAGNRLVGTDVVLSHGLIAKIGRGLSRADVDGAIRAAAAAHYGSTDSGHGVPSFSIDDVEVIDVEGRVVSPGIVDQHSHVTADSLPALDGSSDGNELRPATNPQLRVIDSVNVLDPAFDLVASGGVTTSLILPGSALLMGGEAFAAKMLRTGTNEAQDLSVNLGMSPDGDDGKIWRWMKMACGENGKRVATMFGDPPSSRMGSGWMFRERFERARNLVRKQDDWCESAAEAQKRFRDRAHLAIGARYPDDLINESLAALLRGDIRLNVHCYEPHDLEMMVRNKHEFGFEIATFHHATEAHLVAPLLARENISAAIFADLSLYKKESYSHSVHAGKILHDAGVKFSYKSDHPVLNAQTLLHEAQKAAHYGIDPDLAFMAVTSVPAERMGLGWRIGRIAEGLDADVVIWDREPLLLGAHPLRVFIDGFTAVSRPFIPQPKASARSVTAEAAAPQSASSSSTVIPPVRPLLDEPLVGAAAYTITNISAIFAGPDVLTKGSIVVKDGVVACIGQCQAVGAVFNLNGGTVIPGLVAVNTGLGLTEIDSEETTSDGVVDTATALAGDAHAADGIRVGGKQKHLEYAFRSGVLTGISPPRFEGFAGGFSTAFRTGAELYRDAIVERNAAFHITIGSFAREPFADSVTAQIGQLRRLLRTATPDSPLGSVLSGDQPLVVNVNDPNDISKVLHLLHEDSPRLSRVRVTIAGAAGAWKVADELAALAPRVSVLLQPARCVPEYWETRDCRPPYSRPTAAEILRAAGVPLAVTAKETDQLRALRFEAGWIAAEAVTTGVPLHDAVASVTWTAADALLGPTKAEAAGVGRVKVGARAAFVGVDARAEDVLALAATVQIIADGASVVTQPRQD